MSLLKSRMGFFPTTRKQAVPAGGTALTASTLTRVTGASTFPIQIDFTRPVEWQDGDQAVMQRSQDPTFATGVSEAIQTIYAATTTYDFGLSAVTSGSWFFRMAAWRDGRPTSLTWSNFVNVGDVTVPVVTGGGAVTSVSGGPVAINFSTNEGAYFSLTGTDAALLELTGAGPGTATTVRLLGNANANLASKGTYNFNLVARDYAGNVTVVATTLTVLPIAVVFLKAGDISYTVPSGVANLRVHCIGAGGRGIGGAGGVRNGGGGGAYARKNLIAVSAGNVIPCQIGAAGSEVDTWFSSTGTVLAKAGGNGRNSVSGYGLPGLASASVGDAKFDGGPGGGSVDAVSYAGAGGGGTGGPNGAGRTGGNSRDGAGGGGGANGGGVGAAGVANSLVDNNGAAGGNSRLGSGGGAGGVTGTPAGDGSNGGGGGGGHSATGAGTSSSGGAGSQDTLWTQTSNGETAGPGGGGGGSGQGGGLPQNGGNGGGYGSGGGGARTATGGVVGTGQPGIIVLELM